MGHHVVYGVMFGRADLLPRQTHSRIPSAIYIRFVRNKFLRREALAQSKRSREYE